MTTAFGIEEMRAAIADLSAGNGDAAEFDQRNAGSSNRLRGPSSITRELVLV